MSVDGLCQVCQSARAETSCDRCGNLVCEDHVDRDLGICTECAVELGEGTGSRGVEERDHPDVDGFQF
ncbi:hypothetical protein BRD00_13275 [Halobacteriales archaeon QS_8_69_26]|nr:MAG: hypothetical protein BRD00_13275 [Halobacteriales archaeon QS_8_69_26]